MAKAVRLAQVQLGDHACLTFTDAEERLDLLAAFVRDGLQAGQRVLCWTDQVAPDRLAAEFTARDVRGTAARRRGQFRVASVESALLGADASAEAMVAAVAVEVAETARLGYPGLRLTADMCWATRPAAAEQLMAFETGMGRLFADGRLSVICQYDRDRFDAVTLAFAATAHGKTVAAQVYHDSPLLRICRQYSPPGLRVAGELDYRHRDVLEQALAESRRLDRQMNLNLAALNYIDAACAAAIVQTARRLPGSRRLNVTCHGLVARMLDLTGANETPQLRVRAAYDQR